MLLLVHLMIPFNSDATDSLANDMNDSGEDNSPNAGNNDAFI